MRSKHKFAKERRERDSNFKWKLFLFPLAHHVRALYLPFMALFQLGVYCSHKFVLSFLSGQLLVLLFLSFNLQWVGVCLKEGTSRQSVTFHGNEIEVLQDC